MKCFSQRVSGCRSKSSFVYQEKSFAGLRQVRVKTEEMQCEGFSSSQGQLVSINPKVIIHVLTLHNEMQLNLKHKFKFGTVAVSVDAVIAIS